MKGNTASMIALIVAGLVLLVVGGNSYSKYLRAQYEKEYGVLAKHQNPSPANLVSSRDAAGMPAASMQAAGAGTSTLDPGGALPAPILPPIPDGIVNGVSPTKSQPPRYRTEAPTEQSAPRTSAATDPEIARLKARLKAAEQESALFQQKMTQTGNGGSSPAASLTDSGSASLREVMNQKKGAGASAALFPQGGAPAEEQAAGAGKPDYEKQILNAASAGKVLSFNPDWGFVQIDASQGGNIVSGAKFAVRRGSSIVGYVKVTEVTDKAIIAELTSRNEFSETARKPKAGDDVIAWPLF